MIELRISPGGRRYLAQVPPVAELIDNRGGRKMFRLGPEDAVAELMRAVGDDIDANYKYLQNEKNGLYSELINGDPAAADAIQLRIHAQIRLLSEKLAAPAQNANPISAALVPCKASNGLHAKH